MLKFCKFGFVLCVANICIFRPEGGADLTGGPARLACPHCFISPFYIVSSSIPTSLQVNYTLFQSFKEADKAKQDKDLELL